MISIKAFIDSIHDAVVAANDTLTDSSVGIIAKFFKDNDSNDGTLVPRTINVKYPQISDSGVENIEVEVPLLTLAPITCPTIDSVEFSTKFEMDIINDELQLTFSKENKDTLEQKSNRLGNLKIVISPQDVPEGLKTIVEGYERVLKSQIP